MDVFIIFDLSFFLLFISFFILRILNFQIFWIIFVLRIFEGHMFEDLVVGLPGDFGSFCQPDSTESENSDYVLRGKKACVKRADFLERAKASA